MSKKPVILSSGLVVPAPGRSRKRIQRAMEQNRELIVDVISMQQENRNVAWQERMARQRAEWRQQDKKKFYNPEHELPAGEDPLDKEWNVYAWTDSDHGLSWYLAGERHKKPGRRKPMTQNRLFAGIRQQFGIARDTPVLLVSQRDDKGAESHPAPKHRDTLRPWKPPKEAVALREIPKVQKTKIRKDTSPKMKIEPKIASTGRVIGFTFKTRYVAWGRTGPKHAWFYLGPCGAMTKRDAKREIGHRHPTHSEVVVIDVRTLSYSLRSRIRSNLVPGVTKMEPPHVA